MSTLHLSYFGPPHNIQRYTQTVPATARKSPGQVIWWSYAIVSGDAEACSSPDRCPSPDLTTHGEDKYRALTPTALHKRNTVWILQSSAPLASQQSPLTRGFTV
ncbi:hypothetical protein ST47_g6831 [Ascochyta rabiei]|uniref:Uncharacterized protein n=1 Tax=Didymella rabiei TaxID=5454 RepID=A0A163BVK4_DIDRA|nr:hypothetical protein ST47_g6831 [Ascochyta rabiei]